MKKITILVCAFGFLSASAAELKINIRHESWGVLLPGYEDNQNNIVSNLFKDGWIIKEKALIYNSNPDPEIELPEADENGEIIDAPPVGEEVVNYIFKNIEDWKKAPERSEQEPKFELQKEVEVGKRWSSKVGAVRLVLSKKGIFSIQTPADIAGTSRYALPRDEEGNLKPFEGKFKIDSNNGNRLSVPSGYDTYVEIYYLK